MHINLRTPKLNSPEDKDLLSDMSSEGVNLIAKIQNLFSNPDLRLGICSTQSLKSLTGSARVPMQKKHFSRLFSPDSSLKPELPKTLVTRQTTELNPQSLLPQCNGTGTLTITIDSRDPNTQTRATFSSSKDWYSEVQHVRSVDLVHKLTEHVRSVDLVHKLTESISESSAPYLVKKLIETTPESLQLGTLATDSLPTQGVTKLSFRILSPHHSLPASIELPKKVEQRLINFLKKHPDLSQWTCGNLIQAAHGEFDAFKVCPREEIDGKTRCKKLSRNAKSGKIHSNVFSKVQPQSLLRYQYFTENVLRPGDALLMFNTPEENGHAAIYLGHGYCLEKNGDGPIGIQHLDEYRHYFHEILVIPLSETENNSKYS